MSSGTLLDAGYLYLIITHDFLIQQVPVVKFGLSKNIVKQLAGSLKGSQLLFSLFVHDAHALKKDILKALRENFIQRTDIGTVYFEGDVNNIIALIHQRLASCDRLNLFKSMVDLSLVDDHGNSADTQITVDYTSDVTSSERST